MTVQEKDELGENSLLGNTVMTGLDVSLPVPFQDWPGPLIPKPSFL